jgi:hypothetical protein
MELSLYQVDGLDETSSNCRKSTVNRLQFYDNIGNKLCQSAEFCSSGNPVEKGNDVMITPIPLFV